MKCTEPNKVWKAFHESPLTHSEAHYLMTILDLEQTGKKPHAADLVRALNIAAPTVSQSIKSLIKKGWVIQNEDRSLHLPSDRKEHVVQIERNKALFMDFFVNFLGIEKQIADEDSCKIEHLISPETGKALEAWLHTEHQEQVKKLTEKKSKLPVV